MAVMPPAFIAPSAQLDRSQSAVNRQVVKTFGPARPDKAETLDEFRSHRPTRKLFPTFLRAGFVISKHSLCARLDDDGWEPNNRRSLFSTGENDRLIFKNVTNLRRKMQKRQVELDQQTEALRREWSFLKPFDLDTKNLIDRSAVFQQTICVDGSEVPAFIKIYANKRHPLQRLYREGKSRTEVRNLLFFQSIDIPVPRVIGWGNKKNRIGRIVEEFIITEAVPRSQQLDDYVAEHCPDRSCLEYENRRDQIIKRLGEWTSRMHAANFIHEDLKWRNILARTDADQVSVFWIDCPKGGFSNSRFSLERKKLKDCSTLDKLGRIRCSKEERQAFIKAYLGTDATAESVQQLCHKIETYRRKRFDAKDEQQRTAAGKQN